MTQRTWHIFNLKHFIFSNFLFWVAIVISFGKGIGISTPGATDSIQYIANDNDFNLLAASLKGDLAIAEALLQKGANPNTMIEDGSTPLIFASLSGNLKICKILINKGADINLRPQIGKTALITAAKAGHLDVVGYLIEKGAQIDLQDELGRTALMYAIASGDSAMCSRLVESKANMNIKEENGFDAVMIAIINQQKNIVQWLINKGANPNTTDNDNVSPIMLAVENADYEMIELLLKNGANINNLSKYGETALVISIKKNDEALMQFLISHGADINQRLSLAETPLTIASYYKVDNFIIESLEYKGARQNYFPDFLRYTIGPQITWNLNDLMIGLNLGIKEFKYKFDLNSGIMFRPFFTRVLLPAGTNTYIQYWERRNFVFAGLNKNFELLKNDNGWNPYLTFGLQGLYCFGSYRGTDLGLRNNFLLVPEVGIFHYLKNTQLSLVYQYADFGLQGIAAHRIAVTVKIIFGTTYVFNSNFYKKWD
jgi:ankyrin repeat protein